MARHDLAAAAVSDDFVTAFPYGVWAWRHVRGSGARFSGFRKVRSPAGTNHWEDYFWLKFAGLLRFMTIELTG